MFAARVGVSLSIYSSYISHNHYFPTEFTCSSLGIMNLTAHLVALSASSFLALGGSYPIIAFFVSAIIGFAGTLFMEEINQYNSDYYD